MGVGCFNSQLNINNTNFKIDNKSNLEKKIILIQRRIKNFLNKIRFRKEVKKLLENLSKELERIKLLNDDVITNSKSYLYYKKLFTEGVFKSYSEYIDRNKHLKKKLKIMSEFTLNVQYFIVISQKLAYKGHLNLDKKYHGYGILYQYNNINQKERFIEGIFYNGILSEYGRIVTSKGEMLRGNFTKNKLNGFGEYRRKDDSLYSGLFYDGYPQGNGREAFKDGSYFEGYYIKGKKKYGKFEWTNKNKYEGNFENDLFHGKGTYEWNNKKKYEGDWKFGKMDGKGKLTYANGSYYEGDFVDGMKCGKGKYFWKHGNYYFGEWKDNLQNGFGTYYKNGQKIKGIWENGKIKNNQTLNSISLNKSKRVFSIDKLRINKNDISNRFTYNIYGNNIEIMTKISGDKQSNYMTFKDEKNDEEEKEINLEKNKDDENTIFSIKSGLDSVYNINSLVKKDEK